MVKISNPGEFFKGTSLASQRPEEEGIVEPQLLAPTGRLELHEVANVPPSSHSVIASHFPEDNFLTSAVGENHTVAQVPTKKTTTVPISSARISELDAKQARLAQPAKPKLVPTVFEKLLEYWSENSVTTWKSLMKAQYKMEHGSEPDTYPLNQAHGLTGLSNNNGECYMNASLQVVNHLVATLREKGTPDEKQRVEESLKKMPQFKKLVEGAVATEEDCKKLHQEVAAIIIDDFAYSMFRGSQENIKHGIRGGDDVTDILVKHLDLPPLFFEDHYVSCLEVIDTEMNLTDSAKELDETCTPNEAVALSLRYNRDQIELPLPTAFMIRNFNRRVKKILEPITITDNKGNAHHYQPIGSSYGTSDHAFSFIKKAGSWHEVNDNCISQPFSQSLEEALDHAPSIFTAIVYEKINAPSSSEFLETKEAESTLAETMVPAPDASVAAINQRMNMVLEAMNFNGETPINLTRIDLLKSVEKIMPTQESGCSLVVDHMKSLFEEQETLLVNNPSVIAEARAQEAMMQARGASSENKPAAYAAALKELAKTEVILKNELIRCQQKKEEAAGDRDAEVFWSTSSDVAAYRHAACTSQILSLKAEQVGGDYRHRPSFSRKTSGENDASNTAALHDIKNRKEEIQAWNRVVAFNAGMLKEAPRKFKIGWRMLLARSEYEQCSAVAYLSLQEARPVELRAGLALQQALTHPDNESLQGALLEVGAIGKKWDEQIPLLNAARNKAPSKNIRADWKHIIDYSKNEKNTWSAISAALEAWSAIVQVGEKNDAAPLDQGIKMAHLAAAACQESMEFFSNKNKNDELAGVAKREHDFWNRQAATWLGIQGEKTNKHPG